MNNSYLDKLTKFAEFYFEYTFKGNVTVEIFFEPRSMTYKIKVTVLYIDVRVVSVSKFIEHLTKTTDVVNEFNEMVNDIKEKYVEQMARKISILL